MADTTPPLETRLTRDYGIRHPIAAAGMAFAGMTPALALAVTAAGGIGAVAVGAAPPPVLRGLLDVLAREATGPYDVNFITLFTEPEHVELCAKARVPVVSFHWGHPDRSVIDRLHDAGTRVWEQVGSVEAARRAVAGGIDVVIAQGVEAGGHNLATLPTFALLPAVVDAVGAEALVLGSGGIADGRGLAAALALGADGAWVGTRFVASTESHVHDEYKRRLVAADGTDTRLTGIFGPHLPQFNPMRVLRNRVVAEFEGREDAVPQDTSDQPVIGHTVLGEHVTLRRFSFIAPTREAEGDFEEMPLLAGQAVGLVRDVRPAGEIVAEMAREAAEVLARLAPETR
jgi:enoyl-[acyl-carrier protein] reductase II